MVTYLGIEMSIETLGILLIVLMILEFYLIMTFFLNKEIRTKNRQSDGNSYSKPKYDWGIIFKFCNIAHKHSNHSRQEYKTSNNSYNKKKLAGVALIFSAHIKRIIRGVGKGFNTNRGEP
jgi:hypothetical protein